MKNNIDRCPKCRSACLYYKPDGTIAIGFIELIHEAEKANIGRFLENFRNGYAFVKAYESFDIMTDAIIALRDAYY